MNKTLGLLSVMLLAAACSKKVDEKKTTEPAPVAKITEAAPKEKPAVVAMNVTSKSPEALAAFDKGRVLVENARRPEAREHFKKAIELDPEFALAHSFLGMITPGSEGTDLLAKAGTLAPKASEPEQQWVAAQQALRAGDMVKATAAFEKVLELAPATWQADLLLANFANESGQPEAAIKRLEHALSLKPDLAVAQNGLAYANAGLWKWDAAIAAAKKQTELLPKEPNPQDTLGEVLLWSGKYEESEKAFAQALALEPKFSIAHQGIALTRAYRGDFKGAFEVTDKVIAGTDAEAKYEAMLDGVWYSLADNKQPQAIAYLDKLEADAEAKKLPVYAFAAVERAHVLAFIGKHADAAKWYATAKTRGETLAGDGKNGVARQHALGLLRLAVLSGKPSPDADKLVAFLQEDAKAAPGDKQRQSLAAWGQGLAAWAKTGAKDALAPLATCDRVMVHCRLDLMRAQLKAGDAAAAEATAKEIRETPRRDPSVVYAFVQAAPKSAPKK